MKHSFAICNFFCKKKRVIKYFYFNLKFYAKQSVLYLIYALYGHSSKDTPNFRHLVEYLNLYVSNSSEI